MAFGPGSKLPNGEIVNTLQIHAGYSIYTTEEGNRYKIPNHKEAEYFGLRIERCKWNKDGECQKPIDSKCELD